MAFSGRLTEYEGKVNEELDGIDTDNLILTLERLKLSEGQDYLQAVEDVLRSLARMKAILCGGVEHEQQTETTAQLVQEIYDNHLLRLLIDNLSKIDTEGRKDVVMIFDFLLKRKIGSHYPTVEHICQNGQILAALMTGYRKQELALNCGVMLRECFRHEELAKMVMFSDDFYKFFEIVEVSTFDISFDVFSTIKDLMRHDSLSSEFLQANWDKFFDRYHTLLTSDSHVTRCHALKLLGELILDRRKFVIMTRYVSRPENLNLVMNLMTESSRHVQYEALQVFQAFVANPEKPRPIEEILLRDKDKLIDFLTKFCTELSDDKQFNNQKAYIIKLLEDMKPLEESMVVEENSPKNQALRNTQDQTDKEETEKEKENAECQAQEEDTLLKARSLHNSVPVIHIADEIASVNQTPLLASSSTTAMETDKASELDMPVYADGNVHRVTAFEFFRFRTVYLHSSIKFNRGVYTEAILALRKDDQNKPEHRRILEMWNALPDDDKDDYRMQAEWFNEEILAMK